MAKVVVPVNARVEIVGKIKGGQHGQYRSVLFIDLEQPEGTEEAKIWKSLTPEESQSLQKGAVVQLVPAGKDKNGKDKHNIVLLNSPAAIAAPPAVQTTASMPLDEKRRLAARAESLAEFLSFCDQQVRRKFPRMGDEWAIAQLTAALFQESLRG